MEAHQEKMKTKMKANQEKMEANEEWTEAKMETAINSNQGRIEVTIKNSQEEMKATMRAGQEDGEDTINNILSELERPPTNEWRVSWRLLTNGLMASMRNWALETMVARDQEQLEWVTQMLAMWGS